MAADIKHLEPGKPAEPGHLILERRHQILKHSLPDGFKPERALDIGCGNCAQTAFVTRIAVRTFGVDLHPQLDSESLDSSRRIMVIRASALSLPFRDGCFDLVTAFEVMEHLPDDLSALTEANRVLRPGGWLFLTVPNKWWIFETHGGVVRGLGWIPWNRIPLVSWLPQKLHDRIARARIYTLSRARELVERAGLRIQDCGYVTAPLDVLPEGWLRKCLRRCIFNKRTTRNPLLAVNLYLTAQSSVMLSTVANSNP